MPVEEGTGESVERLRRAHLVWLRGELAVWEREGVLTRESLDALRRHYGWVDAEPAAYAGQWVRWVVYLAVLALFAAFFAFAGSEASGGGPVLRVGVLLVAAVVSFGLGGWVHRTRRIEGIALLLLGGLLVPVAFYFAVYYYQLMTFARPFLMWALLSFVMSCVYAPLARYMEEEGLAGVSILAGCSVPFLVAFALKASAGAFSVLAVVLALVCLSLQHIAPKTIGVSFVRPFWLQSYALASMASILPIALGGFERVWAVCVYGLVSVYHLLQVRLRGKVVHLTGFVLNLVIGVGACLGLVKAGLDLYPLVWLAICVLIVGICMTLLRQQPDARGVLLRALFAMSMLAVVGLFLLRPSHFRSPTLRWFTVCAYGLAGVGCYGVVWWARWSREWLSLQAAWLLAVTWSLIHLGTPWSRAYYELYSVPVGGMLLINAWLFAERERKDLMLTMAVACLAIPSLILSFSDGSIVRTLVVSLGGIALVAVGATKEHYRTLQLGVLVLLPAIFIKAIPGLAELGIPRFVWFGLFGGILVGVAWWLQKRNGAKE
jgi:hypothetical protein